MQLHFSPRFHSSFQLGPGTYNLVMCDAGWYFLGKSGQAIMMVWDFVGTELLLEKFPFIATDTYYFKCLNWNIIKKNMLSMARG